MHHKRRKNLKMNKNLKVFVSVTNDTSFDQRVHKTCKTLTEQGFDVLLTGRKLPNSIPLQPQAYKVKRFSLWFNKGPLFYACYNLRLFCFLLFKKIDILHANDLDSLLANYLIKKIKKCELVYDSHEYFTGVPELTSRPRIQKIWKQIEHSILPNLKHCITVNQSIAQLYAEEYKIKFEIIRNIPEKKPQIKPKSRQELNLPSAKKIILLQGTGINIDRGAEEAVSAMQFVDNAVLCIIGSGDVMPILHKMVNELNLQEKVLFIPRQTAENLRHYTLNADIGITLDKNTNINYRFSLPNKIFDYIQAGLPILASDLPEVKKIVEVYQVGCIVKTHQPQDIATKINDMLRDSEQYALWKKNAIIASEELCWENENKPLISIYKKIQNNLLAKI